MSSINTSHGTHLDQVTNHKGFALPDGNGRRGARDKIKRPNKETLVAMAELEIGNCTDFDSIEDLMADLNAED